MLVNIMTGSEQDIGYGTLNDDAIVFNQLPLEQLGLFAGSPGVDSIILFGGNDLAVDDDGSRAYFGNAGNDRFFGNGGADTIAAGRDNDTVEGGEGDDALFGNIGNDIVRGGDGNDLMFGGQNEDRLFGDAGNDTLLGDLGSDTLEGGDGNDSLIGGAGLDVLVGGGGADVFTIERNNSNNTITDFNEAQGDTLAFSGLTEADVTFSFDGTNTIVTDNLTNAPVAVILGVDLTEAPTDIFTPIVAGTASEDGPSGVSIEPVGGWGSNTSDRITPVNNTGWVGESESVQITNGTLTLEKTATRLELVTLRLPDDAPIGFERLAYFTPVTGDSVEISFDLEESTQKEATLFILPENVLTSDLEELPSAEFNGNFGSTVSFSIIGDMGIVALNLVDDENDNTDNDASLSIALGLGLRPLAESFVAGGTALFAIDPTASDTAEFPIIDLD